MASVYLLGRSCPNDTAMNLDVFEYLISSFTSSPYIVCLCLFTNSRYVLSALTEAMRCQASAFLWKTFNAKELADSAMISSALQARLVANTTTISMIRNWDDAGYDWAEVYSNKLRFMIEESSPNTSETSSHTELRGRLLQERLHNALRSISAFHNTINIRISETYSESHIKHAANFICNCEHSLAVLRALLTLLDVKQVVGGFEVAVDLGDLGDRWRALGFNDIAGTGSPVHLGIHSTAFSIEPDGLLHPVPNCDLLRATELIRQMGPGLYQSHVYLRRAFLPWSAGSSGSASRTKGNFCEFFMENGRSGVRIGIEQHSDKDLPVRAVRNHLNASLSSKGWRMDRMRIE